MTYQDIRYETDGEGILTLTLDRPDQLNAVNASLMHELLDAFDRADGDDAVRAVVVTGAGRAFCAGADLSAGEASFDPATWGEPSDAEKRDAGGRPPEFTMKPSKDMPEFYPWWQPGRFE